MRKRWRPVLTVLAACAAVVALTAPALGVQARTPPAVTVTPGTREPTQRATVNGSHFKPEAAVAVVLGGTRLATATPGTAGSFRTVVTIPRGTHSGTHVLTARQAASGDRATTKLVVRVNWPMAHFNPRNTGYNNLETVLSRHTVTTLQQTQSATTTPADEIVLDNGLVLIASGTTFQALNASTLATEWTASSGDDSIAGLAADNGVVYLAVDNGTLDAFDEATGSFLWDYASGHGPGGTPPIISGGVAYLALGTDVIAVDLATQQALWTDNLGSFGISLALDGTTLYAVDASLYALDAATGATTWSTTLTPSGTGGSVPAIDAAGDLYIGTDTGVMDAYSPDGTLLWSDTLNVTGASEPAVDGTTLYTVATGDNNDQLMALNTSDGSQRWETPLTPGSLPTVADGVVYAVAAGSNGTGSLNAYNSATGAALASYPLNDRAGPPAIIANGTIYQGDNGVTELTPSP